MEAGRFHSGCHEHWQPSVPVSPVLLLRKSRTAADSGGSGCIGRREPMRRATNGGVGVFSDRENQSDAFCGVGLAAAQVAPKCKRFAAASPARQSKWHTSQEWTWAEDPCLSSTHRPLSSSSLWLILRIL